MPCASTSDQGLTFFSWRGAVPLCCCDVPGDVRITPEPQFAYTPLVYTPHNYYTIATQSISLGGKRLVVNQVCAPSSATASSSRTGLAWKTVGSSGCGLGCFATQAAFGAQHAHPARRAGS